MPRYIQKYVLADAWQMVADAVDVPSWLVGKPLTRVFGDKSKTFSHATLRFEDDKHITVVRVEIGDWIVLDHNGLHRMTDAEFQDKFMEIPEWQEGIVPDHAEPLDDDVGEFDYDPHKPMRMLSVHDHVFIKLLAARLSNSSETWMNITSNHSDIVGWTLAQMGYDLP